MIVVGGALIKCSFGVAPTPLTVLPINRILIGGMPAASIMDNKPMLNIIPFGMCSNPTNPAVIAALGAPSACVPLTPAPWMPGCCTVLCASARPSLNKSSMLMCVYGGVITVMPGQFNALVP